MTFVLRPCDCRCGGDAFLVEEPESLRPDREPYRECTVCQGTGTVGQSCRDCGTTGRRRAQAVLTVANLDTGRVASLNVVPGVIDPVRLPTGLYGVDLMPMVRDLGVQVDAATITDSLGDEPVTEASALFVLMPPQWRPGLSAPERLALEAIGIADAARYIGWRIFFARSMPEQQPDPDQRLSWLCTLADQLCLDLVVDMRPIHVGRRWPVPPDWDLRFEIPGTAIPPDCAGRFQCLAEAAAKTEPRDALRRMANNSVDTAAYWITVPTAPSKPPKVDINGISRKLTRLATSAPGAVATWREGRWHYSALVHATDTEVIVQRETGQVRSFRTPIYLRSQEPPPPSYHASAMPHDRCPDCASGTAWRRCSCSLVSEESSQECETCHGAGVYTTGTCWTCQGTRRIHYGAVVTITDGIDRVQHLNWRPEDDQCVQMAGVQPNGAPILQLAPHYRLTSFASTFGTSVQQLTDLDRNSAPDADLCEGMVTMADPSADPVVQYLALASIGRSAARILLYADSTHQCLAELVRSVFGLGLAVQFAAVSHRLNAGDPALLQGEGWGVTVVAPGPAAPVNTWALQPSLDQAISHLLEVLGPHLCQLVPADPDEALSVPQRLQPTAASVSDVETLMRRLAEFYAGATVVARVDEHSCRLFIENGDEVESVAVASTLRQAVTALLGPKSPDA